MLLLLDQSNLLFNSDFFKSCSLNSLSSAAEIAEKQLTELLLKTATTTELSTPDPRTTILWNCPGIWNSSTIVVVHFLWRSLFEGIQNEHGNYLLKLQDRVILLLNGLLLFGNAMDPMKSIGIELLKSMSYKYTILLLSLSFSLFLFLFLFSCVLHM